MDHATALSQTVRVGADGAIERGIIVPHEAANIRGDTHWFASTPRRAHTEHFRGHDGFPGDTWVPDKSAPFGERKTDILAVTAPHDCANHLPGIDTEPFIRRPGWASLLAATRPLELDPVAA